jgi:outer membrane protein OmpA-like peptidoglycan-associated protein
MKFKAFVIHAVLLLTLLSSIVGAQNKSSVENKKTLLKQAEGHYDSLQYENALPLYLKLHQMDTNNAIYNIAIGICYLNAPKHKTDAIPFLERVVVKKGALAQEARFYLGKAYHLAGRFDDAIKVYEKFKSSIGKTDERYVGVSRQIEMCKAGREAILHPVAASLINLAAFINSPYPEYSPLVTADDSTMIFTSRRPGSTGNLRTENNDYYEDVYISNKVNDTIWSSPVPLDANVNTDVHEACVGMSADGHELFIYKDDDGDGNIYECVYEGDKWSVPKKLNSSINTSSFEPSACVSPDGNTLYFVSDRKGGMGGKDIYKSEKMSNGDWGAAVNLGKTINTPFDEDGPFMHADNTSFYFSSTGHSSIGGYDIFESHLNDSAQTWSEPKNVGYPINTVDDDIYFVLSANGKHAYYSSVQENGIGEKDIYMVNFLNPENRNIVLIKGALKDVNNPDAAIHASIKVINKSTNKVVASSIPNIKTGKYTLFVKPGSKYEMLVTTDRVAGKESEKNVVVKDDLLMANKGKYYEVFQDIEIINADEKLKKGYLDFAQGIVEKNTKTKLAIRYEFADSIKKKVVVKDEDEDFLKLMNQSKKIASDTALLKKTIAAELETKPVVDTVVAVKGKNPTREKKAISNDRIVFKTLFFASNTPELTAEGKKELDAVYKIIAENSVMKATINGHADSKGSEELNMSLSKKRAMVVFDYLKNKGIKATRMTVKAFGETEPFASNDTEEGRQANRRVEIKISKD